MAKLPTMYLQTSFDTQQLINLQNIRIFVNGEPLPYVVDCELTINADGTSQLDIIQDQLMYSLKDGV